MEDYQIDLDQFNQTPIFKNYIDVFMSIRDCLEKNRIIPALVLIYSAIDSASWLSSNDTDTKKRFTKWVDTWMVSRHPLSCTSEELYAARCGLLHSFTAESLLNKKKGVRIITYAYGTAEVHELEDLLAKTENSGYIAIHINALYNSFRLGFADFMEYMLENPELRGRLEKKAKKHFKNIRK